jgi:hypothetical protein
MAIAYAKQQGRDWLDVWKCVYLPTDRTDGQGLALWAPISDEPGSATYGAFLANLPKGTACADAVRLIAQVSDWKGEKR